MSTQKFDYVVFIGRFQPVHNGHLHVLNEAKKIAKKGVIVFVGSVNGPRTPKNPFKFNDRANLIRQCAYKMGYSKLPLYDVDCCILVEPVKDFRYSNTAWMESIQSTVKQIARNGESVALIGYHKDESSNYLSWFPQWPYVSVPVNESAETINATDIRDILFENKNFAFLSGVLPKESIEFLSDFKKSSEYVRLKEEYEIIKKYKKAWAFAPYPPTFVTVDAVVQCAGHILMIQRGAAPGKGQWAIPGGFLDGNERVVDGAIRELREETKIDISDKALKGLIRASEVFDAPNRSSRGRTITHAFYFVVDTVKGKLPKVKGSDDAAFAKWIPLTELLDMEDMIFEDHYDIVTKMLGVMK